ncbi:hypothetical protein RND81_08G212600 [Saponaria officinalis]|uniref:CCHC-type domain-containing protein n=1 Tax=Saponaria officinalis TaxID=3572 RepID=A0AAW1JAJ0_SAPOF
MMYVTCAKDLWSELLERYGQANAVENYQIQHNTPLVEYYSILKRLWESLDSLYPIPVCSCGIVDGCTCQLLKKMLDRDSSIKLIQFLMGLNSASDGVRTHILSMDPLPTLDKALSLLQKIERQKQISDAVEVLAEANAYVSARNIDFDRGGHKRPKFENSFETSAVKKCTHCLQTGHLIEDCFMLKECAHCGKQGHIKAHYYKLRGYPDKTNGRGKGRGAGGQFAPGSNTYRRGAHNADVRDYQNTPLDDPQPHHSLQMLFILLAFSDTGTTLFASNFAGILPSSNVLTVSQTSSSHDWIINTGASDHMTFDINILQGIKTMSKPIVVALPDGSTKAVNKSGSVDLSSKVVLGIGRKIGELYRLQNSQLIALRNHVLSIC